MTGNTYRRVGDIHFFGKSTVQPNQINPLLEQKIIWLKHLDAQELPLMLPVDIPKQNLTFAPDHNAIILLGTAEMIQDVEQIIASLDVADDAIRTRQQWATAIEVDQDTELLTVDVKDAAIERVIREIAIRTGINVLILGEGDTPSIGRRSRRAVRTRRNPSTAQGTQTQQTQSQAVQQTSRGSVRVGLRNTVSLRLADATLKAVLAGLLKGTGYTYKVEEHYGTDLYIVGTGELMAGGINPLVTSKQVPLNYLDSTKALELLPATVPDASITVIPDQNALMVMGTEGMVESIETYLKEIDVPTPQVMIQVYLLELTHGSRGQLGLSLGGEENRTTISVGPGFALSFDTLARVPQAFAASLEALVNENRGQVLANPLVTVVSGQTASINVGLTTLFETTTEIYRGADIPIGGATRHAFNEIDTGIDLELTPWISAADEITMHINPNISDADVISKETSTIRTRSIDTDVRVSNGGMIIIGGLLQEKEIVSVDKVPVLHYLPLLGRLFTSRTTSTEQTELIVIIQPKIIESNP
jgi:type II secretory pathway component GspD/PulD (secretin)